MHRLLSVPSARALALGTLLVLAACGGNGKKERTKDPERPTPAAAPDPAPRVEPPPSASPEELYAGCKDRMENPQEAGECKVDADCASAGCNKEVCTTVAKSKDWNTACDQQPCFKVADTCGCHDGLCTWTLKKEAPAPSGLGNRLPPTPPGN